jgi:hypothetical protein
VGTGGAPFCSHPGRSVNPLDQREVRLATRGAIVAAAGFVALYATTGFSDVAYVVGAAIGVAVAGLLFLAARSGRRMLTGLAALAVGLGPWGGAWVLGAPFLLLGGWLLFRARPRERRPAAGGDAGEDEGGDDSSGEAPTGRSRWRRSPAPAAETTARRPPTANKRYTPPAGR